MKKIINITLVIGLVISVGLNIYLYQQIKGKQSLIAATTEEISKIESNLEELENEISSKDSEIVELEGKITELDNSKSELEINKTSLEEEIKGIEEEIAQIEKEKVEKEQAKAKEQTSSSNDIPEDLGYVSIDDLTEEEIQAICDKWGIEYIGSGLDTSGWDHGSGGYGIQID